MTTRTSGPRGPHLKALGRGKERTGQGKVIVCKVRMGKVKVMMNLGISQNEIQRENCWRLRFFDIQTSPKGKYKGGNNCIITLGENSGAGSSPWVR
jgi:hypothetical protein